MFDFATIARGFSSANGGPFHAGVVLSSGAPTVDAGGSITAPGVASSVSCLAQVDVTTEAMRSAEDYQETDVRLLLIDVSGVEIGQRVRIDAGPFAGKVYALQSASRDPATFGWECRGRLAA
jgi:hypothetical protein